MKENHIRIVPNIARGIRLGYKDEETLRDRVIRVLKPFVFSTPPDRVPIFPEAAYVEVKELYDELTGRDDVKSVHMWNEKQTARVPA